MAVTKQQARWKEPAVITCFVMILGIFMRSVWVGAKTDSKIDETGRKVETLEKTVDHHTDEIVQSDTEQKLISKDLEYLKAQNASILDAIKQRR